MVSVRFRPKRDVVGIPGGLSLSDACGRTILELLGERGIADVSAALRTALGRTTTHVLGVGRVAADRPRAPLRRSGRRQRVVAYLGELKRSEQSGWAQLGRKLSGKRRPQPSLFDPLDYDDPSAEEPLLVRWRDVRLERLRDFGDVWMALGLWRLLGLDTLRASLRPIRWPSGVTRGTADQTACKSASAWW